MPNNKPKDRFNYNLDFLSSPDARSIRIMTEFYGPFHLFRKSHVADTIVFFGSARLQSRDEAQSAIDKAPRFGNEQVLRGCTHTSKKDDGVEQRIKAEA